LQIEIAYLNFLDLVNQNNTNNNISVDKERFILLFNFVSNRYVSWILEKRNEDEIRYIQKLLVKNKPLEFNNSDFQSYEFRLPKDFFDHANIYATAGNSNCDSKAINLFEAKSEDVGELLADEYNKPSFEWAETFYHFSSDTVVVYVDNFKVKEVKLTYYRYPKKVDIAGYYDEFGNQSTNIDPELDDKAVNVILLAMSKEFALNNGDANKGQLDSQRLFSPI
jgi:hypothetical protein